MMQHELSPAPLSRRNRKRVGRGDSSGHGSYSGRGQKGQKSRSGHKIPRGFEGGQMPLIKRLPQKRGFVNVFRMSYTPVNLSQLAVFEADTEVTPEKLVSARIVRSLKQPIKIHSGGELAHPLVIIANKFSAAAKAKIEAAGGRAEEVKHAAEAV